MDVSQQLQLIDLDLYIRDPSSPLARAECAKGQSIMASLLATSVINLEYSIQRCSSDLCLIRPNPSVITWF